MLVMDQVLRVFPHETPFAGKFSLCSCLVLRSLMLLKLIILCWSFVHASILNTTLAVFYLGFLVWGGSCEVCEHRAQSRGVWGHPPPEYLEFCIARDAI